MRKVPTVLRLALLFGAVFAPLAVSAQTTSTATSSRDRLFLNFVEDAMIVDQQWWEGRLELLEGDAIDAKLGVGVVAFQPWRQIEVGARVGFGSTDTPPGTPDGNGATDLDAWGKYYFGGGRDAEFSVGAVVTVPTGDESEGLGADAFSAAGFGAVRWRLAIGVLAANVGLRANGDGEVFGSGELDGKVSGQLGLGWLWPWTDAVTFVGELDYESERFEGGEDDTRALAGINWSVGNRGQVRAALGVGLSDGSPDSQVLVGYAYSF